MVILGVALLFLRAVGRSHLRGLADSHIGEAAVVVLHRRRGGLKLWLLLLLRLLREGVEPLRLRLGLLEGRSAVNAELSALNGLVTA